ncbi:hypothetical protein HID58_080683, partial [Brassica napus]
VKEVREKVEVKKETYSIGRRLLNSFDVSERFQCRKILLLCFLAFVYCFFSYSVSLKSITLNKYAHGLQNVFDFGLNGGLLSRSRFGFILLPCMLVLDSISNRVPLEDFGHGHPDPNLTYATGLMSCIVAMDLISELQV